MVGEKRERIKESIAHYCHSGGSVATEESGGEVIKPCPTRSFAALRMTVTHKGRVREGFKGVR